MKLIIVAGARPNFIKIAPLMNLLKDNKQIHPILVHTGQHYDIKMSGCFFEELNIPKPNINLEVGSASQAVQTSRIMEGFEQVCLNELPDAILVVGDVTSTAACALVAAKLAIKVIHYEAGLRSRDRTMPEEINRLVTDAISDIYFTTSDDASDNLINEGVDSSKIYMVGNLMIDTLINRKKDTTQMYFPVLNQQNQSLSFAENLKGREYGVITFHRPSNVDVPEVLTELVHIWGRLSQYVSLVFPIHPRTYKRIVELGLLKIIEGFENLFLVEPMGYLEIMNFIESSAFVLTDSGGIQEETTYMNIPCLTVRPNTERPVTVWIGSNKLIKVQDIESEVHLILQGNGKKGNRPKLWDGKTSERIIDIIEKMSL